MTRWMALLALVPACGFSSGKTSDGGGGDDGAPGTQMCFGTFVKVCFPEAAVPTTSRTLEIIDINTDATDAGSLCNQQNDQASKYCVVAAAGLTLVAGNKLTAHGAKPLVLLSTTTVDLLGDIDISSNHTGSQLKGAGANPADPAACIYTSPPTPPLLGGGGYGGSFGSKGGDGSDSSPVTGNKGLAGPALNGFPAILRGGCPGGIGAVLGAGAEAHGGDGGGAIAIFGAQVHLVGKINASGGGGHGGPGTVTGVTSGGGGGGSGGMIVIDSLMPIVFDTKVKLWANGGGGAQGGTTNTAGSDGNESLGPTQPGTGSSGSGASADGGDGALGTTSAGNGKIAASGGGGGGGGGGVGFIHAPGIPDPTSISPPSSGL